MEDSSRTEASWFARGRAAFSNDPPQSGPVLRDALRVLSIVRALHEAGYQRIRVSTGQGAALFGWEDASDRTARELARMFVERFPVVAARGAGFDRDYADWFAGMMVTAETGRLPIFFADFEIDLSAVSVPPRPSDIRQTGGTYSLGVRD